MKRTLLLCLVLLTVGVGNSWAAIGWAGQVYPNSGSSVLPTQSVNVYVQVWKGGCTDPPGACPDIQGFLMYKKVTDGSYTSAPMSFNTQIGNNDELVGTIPAAFHVPGVDELYYCHLVDITDNSSVDWAQDQAGNNPSFTLHVANQTRIDVTVTFRVDMSCLDPGLYANGVYYAGDFQSPVWSACTSSMTDPDNNLVYEGTFVFPAGSNPYHEYKHNRNGSDGCQWEGGSNRNFTIDDTQPTNILPIVKWDRWDCCHTGGPAAITGPGSYCLRLCPCDQVLSIPIISPYNPPQFSGVTIVPGCLHAATSCNEECTPGVGNPGWGIRQVGAQYFFDICLNTNTNPPPVGGCFCMTIDNVLPVNLLSFGAVPGNGSVTLNWRTASETNTAYFEVSRDNMAVDHVPSLGNDAAGHSYTWTDADLQVGRVYAYSLVSVDQNGDRQALGTVNAAPHSAEVSEYALAQNYPNPFNPTTKISYSLKDAGHVTIKVYGLSGQEVATLVNAEESAGSHDVTFDASGMPSGIYFYKMQAGSFSAIHRMALIK